METNPPLEIGKPLNESHDRYNHDDTHPNPNYSCNQLHHNGEHSKPTKNICIIHFTHASSLNGLFFLFNISTHHVFSHHLGRYELYYIVLESLWSLDTHISMIYIFILTAFFSSILVCVCCGSFMVIFPCISIHTHTRNRVNNFLFLCPIENGHMKREKKPEIFNKSNRSLYNELHVYIYFVRFHC